jgi:pimeloyl-ACP methyl ester carboxylesterase
MGDPILLVHGVYPGASHHEFRWNIDALARQYTVYAIDLLGFGESDMPRMTYTAEIYQHLLREFIVEEIGAAAHLLAAGMSCGPAVGLGVYEDKLLNKIILSRPITDAPADADPPLMNKVQQFLLGTLSLGTGLYEVVSSEIELDRFLRSRYAQPKHATPQLVHDLRKRAARPHALYGFISSITGHLAMDVPRWLRYVPNSVLIVWGEQSGAAPVERLLRPATWSRGKRLEIIPNAGHWPHDEQSAKFNQLALEFLG